MATTTTRNGLSKSEATDLYQVTRTGNNTNFDVIDAALAKCNFVSTQDPTADDDEADGYSAGSKWFNCNDGKIFICQDATETAAVWRQVYPALTSELSGSITNAQLAGSIADGKLASSYLLADGSRALSSSLLMAQIATPAAPEANYTKIYTKSDGKIYKIVNGGSETEVGAQITDHGALGGLSDDDHPQYLLANGSRALAGAWSAGSNRITTLPAPGGDNDPLRLYDLMDGIYRQALINASFAINQHAVSTYTSASTPANDDGAYLFDQWILLSNGADVVDVSQETSVVPTGAVSAAKLEVETANKKFGFLQLIEAKDAQKFAGQIVSLQFKARTASGKEIRNLRAAVLSWAGTADSPTRDVVSAWNAEGSNPTLAASWTAENTAENLVLSNSAYTTYKIENISVDTANMTNLAVFIWVDDADAAVDDLLYLSQAQLNVGPICLPYMPRSFADELRLCQRYYEKSYAYGVAPGTASTTGAIYLYLHTAGTGYIMTTLFYKVPKRIAVAPTLYDAAGAVDKITYDISTNGKTGTAGQQTESNCRVYSDNATSKNGILFHYVLDARL